MSKHSNFSMNNGTYNCRGLLIRFWLLLFDALVIIWFLWIVICYFIKMHSTQIDIEPIKLFISHSNSYLKTICIKGY